MLENWFERLHKGEILELQPQKIELWDLIRYGYAAFFLLMQKKINEKNPKRVLILLPKKK
jgi:hypothetical protein